MQDIPETDNNNIKHQQHAPAFVHATVYLRQNDPDSTQVLATWKSLFNRWEDIFSSLSSSSSFANTQTSSNANNNNNKNYDNDYLYGHYDDEEDDHKQYNAYYNNSDTDNDNSNSNSNFGNYHSSSPPPPPGAIMFRLLLAVGSVIPGSLPQNCPQFRQERYSEVQARNAATKQDLNPMNSSVLLGGGDHHHGSSSTLNDRSADPQQQFESAENKMRNDDSLAALAYAEWWQWLLSQQSSSSSSASFGSVMMSSGKSKGSIFSNNNNSAKLPATDNTSSGSNKSINNSSSSSSAGVATAKFLFSTAIKIGCLLQFVSITGLRDIIQCGGRLSVTTVTRAQAALIATLTKISPVSPLPPPFLLAHLPRLYGATGEAFTDVLQDDEETATSSSVDFFTFIVQRAISVLPVSFQGKPVTMQKENEVGLELKFLDQISSSTSNQDEEDNTRRRNRDDEHDGISKSKGSVSSSNYSNSNKLLVETFTPKWSYGCLRFTTLLPRSTASIARQFGVNTTSVSASAIAASLAGAASNMIHKDPSGVGGLLHRFPQYDEVFGIRYVVLLAQRMLTMSLRSNNNQDQASSSSLQLLRLAARLAFWASTAAASFPMELPTAVNVRGGFAGATTTTSGSKGLNHLKKQKSNKNNATAIAGEKPQFSFKMLLSLEDLNELVTIPCMSASLCLYCSLAAVVTRTQQQHQSANRSSSLSGGAASEALLSVALAYASCTFAARSSSVTTSAAATGSTTSATTLRRRAEAIRNLQNANEQLSASTKKNQQQQKQNNKNSSTEQEQLLLSSLEEDIKLWTSMHPRERSALTLRFLLISLASQWIACYPLKQLQSEVPRHVIASLPEELRTVLECKLNPSLIDRVLGKNNSDTNKDAAAQNPRFFSFNPMKMKRQQQQQQDQVVDHNESDDARMMLDFEDDEEETDGEEKQTMKGLLLLWSTLESSANEELKF